LRANELEYHFSVIPGEVSRFALPLVCAAFLCAGCATVQPVTDATHYAEHQARESEALATKIDGIPPGALAAAVRECAQVLRSNSAAIRQLQSDRAGLSRQLVEARGQLAAAESRIRALLSDNADLELYRGLVWGVALASLLYLVWRVSRWIAEKYAAAHGGQIPAALSALLRIRGGGPLVLVLGILIAGAGRPASAATIRPADQAHAAFERDVAAVIAVESSGRPWVVSPAGAVGLMQLMPATARSECGLSRGGLLERRKNEECGRRYLAKLQRLHGRTGGLAAYNIGPGTLSRLGYTGAALRYLAKIRDAGGLQ